MTGRELMMFILENNLENENIFSENILSSICMSASEAAIKFDTGISTINTWIKTGMIPSLTIDGITYVYKNAVDPRLSIKSEGKKKKKLQKISIGNKRYITVKPKVLKEMVNEEKPIK